MQAAGYHHDTCTRCGNMEETPLHFRNPQEQIISHGSESRTTCDIQGKNILLRPSAPPPPPPHPPPPPCDFFRLVRFFLNCTMVALAISLLAVTGAQRIRPVRMLGNLFSGLTAPLPDPIDYLSLRGLPKSLGGIAGEYAGKGEVAPEKSKDGMCFATFGGGCFWGTEVSVSNGADCPPLQPQCNLPHLR